VRACVRACVLITLLRSALQYSTSQRAPLKKSTRCVSVRVIVWQAGDDAPFSRTVRVWRFMKGRLMIEFDQFTRYFLSDVGDDIVFWLQFLTNRVASRSANSGTVTYHMADLFKQRFAAQPSSSSASASASASYSNTPSASGSTRESARAPASSTTTTTTTSTPSATTSTAAATSPALARARTSTTSDQRAVMRLRDRNGGECASFARVCAITALRSACVTHGNDFDAVARAHRCTAIRAVSYSAHVLCSYVDECVCLGCWQSQHEQCNIVVVIDVINFVVVSVDGRGARILVACYCA
jgi:hypothetical protein